jgi:hypothetical protein
VLIHWALVLLDLELFHLVILLKPSAKLVLQVLTATEPSLIDHACLAQRVDIHPHMEVRRALLVQGTFTQIKQD